MVYGSYYELYNLKYKTFEFNIEAFQFCMILYEMQNEISSLVDESDIREKCLLANY